MLSIRISFEIIKNLETYAQWIPNKQCKKRKRETEVSPKSINFVLHMYHQLTSEQRYAISALHQQKTSKKVIAQTIGVHPSTVYREISRNASRNGHYSKTLSHTYALERRERLPGNRAISPAIKKKALDLLRRQLWSPVQIAGYLRMQGIAISHETIYRMIRADHTGELAQYTHHHMKYRHHKLRARPYRSVSIPNRVSIHDRPAEADGTRFGDWEMDLILGKGQRSAILTLTERKPICC